MYACLSAQFTHSGLRNGCMTQIYISKTCLDSICHLCYPESDEENVQDKWHARIECVQIYKLNSNQAVET